MKCVPCRLRIPVLAIASSLLLASAALQAQESNTLSNDPGGVVKAQEVSLELMKSFLHLQEQVHTTQMAVERSRLEAEGAATRNTEALNARLSVIENSLDQAHKDSSLAVQETSRQIRESNRQVMMFAGVFATVGFLALGLTGWLQWKTASMLNKSPSPVGFPALMPTQNYGALGFEQSGQASGGRLMDALGRLEHRIAGLEVGHRSDSAHLEIDDDDSSHGNPAARAELTSLIRGGEELLAHEEAEKAIEHFDAILAKHPGHPEVLLHKGAALERLQKDQEAIDCYDQAIRADKHLTMAYLHKGGLYNRMEKFNEAMECYEQALKVQEGRTTVS